MPNKRKKAGQYILMVLITVLVVFPFLWMLVLSLKTNSEILSSPLSLPKTFNFDNFRHALETLDFPRLYGNTFFVCIISMIAELVITFLSSFVLARMEFKNEKLRKMLYGFLIMGLSISPFILLFPVYKINVFFGLRGKWALIFPYIATSISFNTLLLVGYLKSLPTEIDEAAVIDGAGPAACFFKITIPILTPTIFFVVITSIISSFQIFDTIFMMIPKDSPAFSASQTLVMMFYRNAFDYGAKGYAAAISSIVFLIVMLVTAVQFGMQKKWVHYE